MSETGLWILDALQLQKHQDIITYLSLTAPNKWHTASELDQRLPFGSLVSNFPAGYWTALAERVAGEKYGLQVQLAPTRAISYRSVTFTTSTELLQALPQRRGDESHCVGLNTMVMESTDTTQQVIRDAIQQRLVYFVPNQPGRSQCGYTSNTQRGSADGGGEEKGGGDGSGENMLALDGGRDNFGRWQREAPIGVVQCEYTTRRRVKETSFSRMLQSSIEVGERLTITFQRQDSYTKPTNEGQKYVVPSDTAPHPRGWARGTELGCSFLLDGEFVGGRSVAGRGLHIEPSVLHFPTDGSKAVVRIQATRAGAFLLGLKVDASAPSGMPPPSLSLKDGEVSMRMTVSQSFPFTNSMNTLTKEHIALNKGAVVEPIGGVVLYGVDTTCPLPLPRSMVLDVFTERAEEQPSGLLRPNGLWWADPSPHFQQACVTAPTVKELQDFKDWGSIVDIHNPKTDIRTPTLSALTTEMGASMQSRKERAVELTTILRQAREDGARRSEEDAALKKRRESKRRLARDLCNKHMLNYGINLLKLYRPRKKGKPQ